MSELPDFLKNHKPTGEVDEHEKLIRAYEEKFHTTWMIHNSSYTYEEIDEILKKCLETGQDWWEYTGDGYDPDCYY